MTIAALRVQALFTFPSVTIRLWEGSGPYIDVNGDIWAGCGLTEGLDVIEQALNGEAYTLDLGISGLDPGAADLAWDDYQAGNIIGSTVKLMTQACDKWDQPTGTPKTRFTGRIDNIQFSDFVAGDEQKSTVLISCTNRFTLRRMTSGSVLSDIDQRARSAILNPEADPDRIAERVSILIDQTLDWPRFT